MRCPGAVARKFETAVAAYTDYKHGIATASGGAAFQLILQALGIGPSDEVILPTYVCKICTRCNLVRRSGSSLVRRFWAMVHDAKGRPPAH